MAAGIDIHTQADFREVRRWLRAMPDKVVDQTMVRSLNRLGRVAITQTKRHISRPTGLKQRYVGKWLRLKKAKRGHWEARLEINRIQKNTSLIQFPHRVKWIRKKGRKYQQIEFKKSLGSYSPVIGALRDKLFKATSTSGSEQIFKRRGRTRLPIDKVQGPSMGRLFTDFAETKVSQELRARWKPEVERNLNYYMTRHNRRHSSSSARSTRRR